jgi:hypothetical protein
MAMRDSSASLRPTLTSSLRRSSLNSGIGMRMIRPSLIGVMPTLAARIAFSMAPSDVGSYGLITIRRASGVEMLAISRSRVAAP